MSGDIAKNKKARRDYHILEKFECGIDLRGTEVKSIREGKVNIGRRLLLHKREILKLQQATQMKGETLVALRLYFKGRRVKVEIGLAKGKSHGDQRDDLKKRVELREAQREMARFNRGH